MTLLGFKRSLFFTIKDKNANEKVTEKRKIELDSCGNIEIVFKDTLETGSKIHFEINKENDVVKVFMSLKYHMRLMIKILMMKILDLFL